MRTEYFNLAFHRATITCILNRYGLQDLTIPGIGIVAGDTTLIDTILHYIPVPPAYVQAGIMDNDTLGGSNLVRFGPGIVEESYR